MLTNYHTHTKWCKHGFGEIEEYIERAIECGMEELAITEHVPHRDNLDAWRMQWEEFPAFDKALDEAIARYQGRIRVLKGLECEYYPEELYSYRRFRDQYGYRLLILGQHRSGRNREFDNFANKDAAQMHLYADEVCEGLRTGLFTFLAHPDLALQGYQEEWDGECESVMDQIFSTCQECGIPVEININGLRNGKRYPSEQAFSFSKNYDLRYLINADAHRPNDLCDEKRGEAEEFAKRLGITVTRKLDLS